jgi:mRNA interferase RelE/StbE
LRSIPREEAKKVLNRIISLETGLTGDIKKLTAFTPEYRLRIGDYRVLFEIEGDEIIVYRIKHRKDIYKKEG